MDRIGHGAVLKILSTSPRSVRRSLHHVRPDHACHEGADVQPPSTRVPKNNRQPHRHAGQPKNCRRCRVQSDFRQKRHVAGFKICETRCLTQLPPAASGRSEEL